MEAEKYLELLSENFPNIPAVSTEIINLKAILNLPKSTEHFLTDLHAEDEAFQYMLKTASGVIEYKIDQAFDLSQAEKNELATLIFYPEEKLEKLKANQAKLGAAEYQKFLNQIIKLSKDVSSIYTRSKVRKALPEEFAYIIEELLHLKKDSKNKKDYHDQIVKTIIEIGQAENFIISLAQLIQTFAVDKLHIVGDIFDRGPNPHKIMDVLKNHHDVDLQWGNHDILWMGAGLGQKALIATAVRISLRYGNLELLEEGYRINMRPLARLARNYYQDFKGEIFCPKLIERDINDQDKDISAQMQKAIAIIQFKLEGQLIKSRPEFKMNEALYLEKIDYKRGILTLNEQEYPLIDNHFPTIDPKNPYQLNEQEQEVIDHLSNSFQNNDRLQEDIRFIFNNGSMYKKYNGNLLFHGCVPLKQNGDFAEIEVEAKKVKGKKLLDFFQDVVRHSYSTKTKRKDKRDWLWYLWRGEYSPLFGKDRMTTFLRYFTDEDDKELYQENKNPYYSLREKEEICNKILKEFEMDPEQGVIINGHTPVEEKRGESPIKGQGKLLVIDGGISAAYHKKTGIAGYTLIYSDSEMRLISHKPFVSKAEVLKKGTKDTHASKVVKKFEPAKKISDTDIGIKLKDDIKYLEKLLKAYQNGTIKEKYN